MIKLEKEINEFLQKAHAAFGLFKGVCPICGGKDLYEMPQFNLTHRYCCSKCSPEIVFDVRGVGTISRIEWWKQIEIQGKTWSGIFVNSGSPPIEFKDGELKAVL